MLVVMTGNAVAQVIGFALSPVISRLFSPSDFGEFGTFSAVLTVISAGVTLEYSQAIMLPKNDNEAFNLLVISVLSTIVIALGCIFTYLAMPSLIGGVMPSHRALTIILLACGIAAAGINSTCQAWCVRAKAFRQTSTSQVIRSTASNSSQIIFGMCNFGAIGLMISNVLADTAASGNLVRAVRGSLRDLKHSVNWHTIKALAYEYRDFPLYSASQRVVNAVSVGLPVVLLTHYYGLAVAGAYTFGMRIIWTPMSFVLSSLRQVLFQKACEAHRLGKSLVSIYVKVTLLLFAVAILPALGLILWAPSLFSFVFGAKWSFAGELAVFLVIWLLFAFCNLPAVLFARLIRIQRTVFLYDLAMLVCRSAALIVGGAFFSANTTVLLYSVIGSVMNVFLIILVGRSLMQREGPVSLESLQRALG